VKNDALEKETIRVLLVDDSNLIRTLIQDILQRAGFIVLTAADGMEAWKLLQKEQIHLVVSDVYMPNLDGLELTRLIRADENLSTIAIILISATDIDENQRLGMNYGANAFIMKEKRDLDTLPNRIREMLRA
jgi:two-component system, chemotaxis family, sensor kinase CheA